MKGLLSRLPWIFSLLYAAVLPAAPVDREFLMESVERAYNFEKTAFEWFESEAFDRQEPLHAFVAATAAYWIYQADRINASKRAHAETRLTDSIELSEALLESNPKDAKARFLYGVNRCNRARFYVEESSWFRAYLDAREGLRTLEKLVEDEPDFADAYFALGVAECFLSDAPSILKPLARLLGFRGSSHAGIEKLQRCIDDGEWTMVEASYYLAYYYYNIAADGPQAVASFAPLAQQYPFNPLFAYFLGRSYQIDHKPLDALEVYQRSRDISYQVGAEDIGNWSSFRIGTILQGEHFYREAAEEYQRLQKRLTAEMQEQEYFYLLPLKIAECLIVLGEENEARAYLEVIRSEWDRDTYRKARDLLKSMP